MLREMPSPSPASEEAAAPESRERPIPFTIERDGDALRFTVHDEHIHDVLSHVLLDRFPLEDIHQRRILNVLHFMVDNAATLTDEQIDEIKEEVAVVGRRVHTQPPMEHTDQKAA